jgi:N-acetylglutamate synthase-like GNAT family acetyltransferase
VRHARADDLGPVAQLLEHLRSIDGLAERSAGTFYRDSSAFLHFHVDSTGLFADVKADGEFERRSLRLSA